MKIRRSLSLPFVLTAGLSSVMAPALAPSLAFADTTVKPKLPRSQHPERVQKSPDGKCYERSDSSCPPNVHCNPGPPHEVECPPEPKPAK